jgi:prophage regulatory protein
MSTPHSSKPPSDSLALRSPELCALVGVSPRTVHRLVARGEFPPPRKLGDRCVAWLRSEVETWLAARPISDIPSPQVASSEHGGRQAKEAG